MRLILFALFCFSLISFSGAMVLSITFYIIYFGPTDYGIVTINSYGEAMIEALVCMPLLIFSGVMTPLISLKIVKEGIIR